MKYKLLFLVFLFSSSILFSQTANEKKIILKETNVSKLLNISKNTKEKAIKDKNFALSLAKIKGWDVFIKDSKGSFSELMSVNSLEQPIYYTTYNYGAGLTARTNHLYSNGSLGLNIEGQNMIAGEWDGGGVRLTHELFEGRVTQMDAASSTHYHSTHVAGTIIGSDQVQGGNARGMAFKANLHAYEWNNDQSEVAQAAANGLLISNHSYGHNPAYLSLHQFGKYESDANAFDDIMYNAPYYLFVAAAGNARDDGINAADGGYDLLSGHTCTKNSMVVAAVNELTNYTGASSVIMSSFSSWGPTDDGRIKPDISAKGVDTFSASDNYDSDYITISGTSMASPSVTGTLLLMQQYYNQQNGVFMHSSTLRGLALHTADEAGNNPGPDYEFGWGLINAKKAAEVIRDNGLLSYISEETLNQGDSYSISFDALGSEPLKATICWTDPAGNIITNTIEDFYSPALVNDLDIRITKNGTTYFPWKLDPNNPSAAATKGDNIVDNIEQVEINNPVGTYTLTVTHKGILQSGSQNFSVIVSGISFNDFYITSTDTNQNICEGDNAIQYNLDLTTISGFSDNVTFSTVNLPVGVNANFSPSSLNTQGNFTLNLTNLSGLASGIYPFTIHGQSSTDSADLDVELHVFGTNFNSQILNNPIDNTTSIPINTTFSWENNPNAQQYLIQIATDNAFTNIVENTSISSTNFQATTLVYNTTYYWRVQPINICGNGSFSSVYSFTTACLGPTDVLASNVLLDSAEVSWTENSGGSNWELEVVEVGSSPTGIGMSINTNPYTVTGLNSSTDYIVYVRSDCGNGNFSEWGISSPFTTAADFCSGDHFYDTGGVSGSYSNNENNITTIAPSTGNNTVYVQFNSFILESSFDYLSVYNGSDTNAPLLGTFSGSTIPGPFTSNNPNGTLTFRFTSDGSVTYDGWDASVTCFNLTCPQPSNIVTNNLTENSVDLSWVNGGSETSWELEYGLTGFTQGTGTLSQVNNPYSITGLNPNTSYDVYLRANCGTNPGDDDSLWLMTSFTTLVSCPSVSNLYTTNTTYNSTVANWTNGGSETSWEIEYGNSGFTQGTGTLVQTNTNPYTITGLSPNTSYKYYVRANCGVNIGDDDSNWVGPYYFNTSNLPYPTNLTTTLNQTNGEVTLNWNSSTFNTLDFVTYYIYRDGALIATETTTTYIDQLPIYGNYSYFIRAHYDEGDSYQSNTSYVSWISCPIPTNLTTSNEALTSVDLNWDAGNTETNWEIEYGDAGFTQGTGTIVQTNTNPFTLTGLNSSTNYDVYLRANCGVNPGDDDSNWVGPISFSTLCDVFIAPFMEDFENGSLLNSCWIQETNDDFNWSIHSGGTASYPTGPNTAYSGTYYIYTETSTPVSNGYSASIYSPQIDLSTLTVAELNFAYHMYGNGMDSDGNIDVAISTDGGINFTSIFNEVGNHGNQWNIASILLTSYTGVVQFKITGTVSTNGTSYENDFAIDSFSVNEAPTCPQPSNLVSTNVTASSVDLSWTTGNTETNWEIEYGDAGFSQGTGTIVQTNTNPFTLTGLNSSTSYDVYLRANCGANPGDDDSNWVGPISFTTFADYCSGDHFYDTGGLNGNYSNNENTITTIVPSTGFNAVSVVFNSFNLESCCDNLSIYNGLDTNAPLIGTFTSNPGTINSDNIDGALTFRFTSDGSITYSGWDATVTCINITCPQPSNLVSTNITASSVDLSWTAGNTETNWEIEYGDIGFTQGTGTIVQTTTNPFTLTGLNSSTSYDVYLRANCGANPGDDDSNWVGPISFTTNTLSAPANLTAQLNNSNGEVQLNWNENTGFQDDFDNPSLWVPVTGSWNLSNGFYEVSSSSNQASSSYYNQVFSNFEFEVRMKKTAGSDCNMSLYFNGNPNSVDSNGYWNNGYQLLYCTTNGTWILTKMVNGNWVNIRDWDYSNGLNLGINSWNTIKVTVINGYIEVFFNDISQGTYFDDTFTSGYVGINMADSNINGVAEYDYAYLNEISTNYNFTTVNQSQIRNVYNGYHCPSCQNQVEPIGTELAPTPTNGLNYTYEYTNFSNNAFLSYNVYRDNIIIANTTNTNYLDQLPAYGDYQYYVTAMYDEGESLPSNTVDVSWHGTPNIVVNPLSLTQTLYTNETATQTLTISNTGDDNLDFNIQSTVVSTNSENQGYWVTETNNLTPQIIGNSTEEITITPQFSKRTYFNVNDLLNVLIYEEIVDAQYYTDALIDLGFTFTQVSSWNNLVTSLNDGTNWDLVIVNSYNYPSSNYIITQLDTYQSNGGKLIFADWSMGNNYNSNVFLQNIGISYVNEILTPLNFSATDASHAIFNNPYQINTFNWNYNQYDADGQFVNVINGATQLAAFDGYPQNGAIVLSANENVIFNAFQSDNYHRDDNANGMIDIQELIENEITFLSGLSWLSTTQTSGTISPGGTANIDVHFDSTNLATGTYVGNIRINSNDPDEPIVDVPAELIVIDDTNSINELSQFNFKYYPNPFKDSINISANQNFTSIKIYSLLGQEIISINPENKSQLSINMSNISIGTYFMKVEIDNKISSMKIIKK